MASLALVHVWYLSISKTEVALLTILFLSEDAFFRTWRNWSQCTISCVDEKTKVPGTRYREAECVEGSNGGLTCFDLLGTNEGKKNLNMSLVMVVFHLKM